jgi:hypothetical protein
LVIEIYSDFVIWSFSQRGVPIEKEADIHSIDPFPSFGLPGHPFPVKASP